MDSPISVMRRSVEGSHICGRIALLWTAVDENKIPDKVLSEICPLN